jgi:hypothetical protein
MRLASAIGKVALRWLKGHPLSAPPAGGYRCTVCNRPLSWHGERCAGDPVAPDDRRVSPFLVLSIVAATVSVIVVAVILPSQPPQRVQPSRPAAPWQPDVGNAAMLQVACVARLGMSGSAFEQCAKAPKLIRECLIAAGISPISSLAEQDTASGYCREQVFLDLYNERLGG